MPHQLLTNVPTNHCVTCGTLVHRSMIVVPVPRSYSGSFTLWLCVKCRHQSIWWNLGTILAKFEFVIMHHQLLTHVPTKHCVTGGTLVHEIMLWCRTWWATTCRLIPGPHQKSQERSQPKIPALCILRKYRAGIYVGWSCWSGWKKGRALDQQLQPTEIPSLYSWRIRRAGVFGWLRSYVTGGALTHKIMMLC